LLAGFNVGSSLSGVPSNAYDDEHVYRGYQMIAAMVPDKLHMIPSHYGALPFPVQLARLTYTNTFTLTTGQALTITFQRFYSDATYADKFAAGVYCIGAYGSDQRTTDVSSNIMWYNQRLGQIVPTGDSTAATTGVKFMAGSFGCQVIKSSYLDEDPSFTYTGASNVSATPQWSGNPTVGSTAGYSDHIPLQSLFGTPNIAALGNELPGIPLFKGQYYRGLIPIAMFERGTTEFRPGVTVTTVPGYPQWQVLTANTEFPAVTVPSLTVKNNASNSITIVFKLGQNVEIIPTEQAVASNPGACVRSSRYPVPTECLTLSSAADGGKDMQEAMHNAIERTKNHPHHGPHLHPHIHAAAASAHAVDPSIAKPTLTTSFLDAAKGVWNGFSNVATDPQTTSILARLYDAFRPSPPGAQPALEYP
jgi:hypothetical protein